MLVSGKDWSVSSGVAQHHIGRTTMGMGRRIARCTNKETVSTACASRCQVNQEIGMLEEKIAKKTKEADRARPCQESSKHKNPVRKDKSVTEDYRGRATSSEIRSKEVKARAEHERKKSLSNGSLNGVNRVRHFHERIYTSLTTGRILTKSY